MPLIWLARISCAVPLHRFRRFAIDGVWGGLGAGNAPGFLVSRHRYSLHTPRHTANVLITARQFTEESIGFIVQNLGENLGVATILVVDDSYFMLDIVSFALKRSEHQVIVAVDGVEALEKAKHTQADLVITDISMPRMDGFQLIKELRGLTTYRFTPLLVLTTEFRDDQKNRGKAAGATGWLVKPFDPDELLAVVNRVLN